MFKLSFVISLALFTLLLTGCALFSIFALRCDFIKSKAKYASKKRRVRARTRERERYVSFLFAFTDNSKKVEGSFFSYTHFFFSFMQKKKRRSNNHWLFDSIYSNAANKVFYVNVHFLFFQMTETNEVSRDNILTRLL
jgi:hypothetical protein